MSCFFPNKKVLSEARLTFNRYERLQVSYLVTMQPVSLLFCGFSSLYRLVKWETCKAVWKESQNKWDVTEHKLWCCHSTVEHQLTNTPHRIEIMQIFRLYETTWNVWATQSHYHHTMHCKHRVTSTKHHKCIIINTKQALNLLGQAVFTPPWVHTSI